MDRCPGRQVPCARTFVNAVQDYGTCTFSPINQGLRPFKISPWNLKFCKLLGKNRMLVADDLHYE
jgi:hypothetical protein